MGLFLTLFLLAGATTARGADPVSLTILHTNDTHGHLLPFSYPERAEPGSPTAGLAQRRDIGGIARRASLVSSQRAELDGRGIASWLIDCGDYCDGTPFSTEYHGEADVAAMNAAGYDFATLGNHEFNNTLAQLRKLVGMSRFAVLCANASTRENSQPLTTPWTIRAIGPVRIGLFGIVTRDAGGYPAAREGVDIEDELPAARRVVEELRDKTDILVLISHAGLETDLELAGALPEIDVIVGGHSHSRLPSGEFVWGSEALSATEVNGTIVVQAHQWGGELGRLDLLFQQDPADGTWSVGRYRARLMPITSALPDHPEVAAVVEQYWEPIAGKYGEVIAQAEEDFAGWGDDRAEYNLVADAVREIFRTDLALENLGGVRAPILRGDITRADLVTMDPFNNTVVTFRISGAELRRVLAKYQPAVSGIRYRVQGDEVVEATVNGKPLRDDKKYRGAGNSYFAGYALKGIEVKDSGRSRLSTIEEYLRRQKKVRPSYDGRRRIVD